MFSNKLSQVTEQLDKAFLNSSVQDCIAYGINLWCNQLKIDLNIKKNILNYYQYSNEIQNITNYLCEEWQLIRTEEKNLFEQISINWLQSPRNSLIRKLLRQINVKSGNMEFIALIAFVITAVGYWLYVSNQPRQQSTHTRTYENYSNINSIHIQKNNKQILVLAVSAEEADLIHSMKMKEHINSDDGEKLYEITKYLWLGSENEFIQRESNNKSYLVTKNKELEFDTYFVYLKLKQSDEGFKPNVGQLARYDAFRNLANLKVSFEISPRLQMEAYRNFELYNR